jgi:hypothetical protein
MIGLEEFYKHTMKLIKVLRDTNLSELSLSRDEIHGLLVERAVTDEALHALARKDDVVVREALKKAAEELAKPVRNLQQAEEDILGMILLDNSVIERVMDQLSPHEFRDRDHGHIYSAMCALHLSGMPVDIESLSKALKGIGSIKRVGGVCYLASLTLGLPARPLLEEHVRLVKSCHQQLLAKMRTDVVQ